MEDDLINFDVGSIVDFPNVNSRDAIAATPTAEHSLSPVAPTKCVSPQYQAVPFISVTEQGQEMENEYEFGNVPIPRGRTSDRNVSSKANSQSPRSIPTVDTSYRNVVKRGKKKVLVVTK